MAHAWIMETTPSNAYVLPVSLVIAVKSVSISFFMLICFVLFLVFFFSKDPAKELCLSDIERCLGHFLGREDLEFHSQEAQTLYKAA